MSTRPQRRRAASTISASEDSVVSRRRMLRIRRTAVPWRPSPPRRRDYVDREHLGAFLRETQNRGAAVAQPLARRLTGADHDRDLVLETHANLVETSEWAGGAHYGC